MALTEWLHGFSAIRSLHPWATSDGEKTKRFFSKKKNKAKKQFETLCEKTE